MTKLIAILNVIAWSGFWAFGYIALTSEVGNTGQMVTAAILAFVGALLGIFAYLWLVRHTEQSGYAKAPKRAFAQMNDENEGTA